MANISGRPYASLRIPARWQEEERSLVRQIQDLFDRLFLGNRLVRKNSKEMKSMANLLYPVGSIYMNISNSTTPAEIFGGEWEAVTVSPGYGWKRTKLWGEE